MLERQKKEFRIITAENAQEFQDKMNALMGELAADRSVSNVEFTFNLAAGHCAYFYFDRFVQIPENIQDEFALRGLRYYCVDCPLYKPSEDRRVKWTHCAKAGCRISAESCACDEFYAAMARFEMKGGEEA